ncbi:PH domain-containing protein [Nocardiopsis xinjiangensis]|uniref:PH domain-containing protein n=1 Tax=Nocardiopsis xinjiangensis TaxID=124285 RepID=UPI00034C32FE|nr:PH domain-containing protein [Nocardiopsis xinjiangensis]
MLNSPAHDGRPEPGEGPREHLTEEGRTAELRPPLRRVSGRAVGVWTVRMLLGVALKLVLISVVAVMLTNLSLSWIPDRLSENARLLPIAYGVYGLVKVAVVPSWRYRVHRWEVGEDVIYTRAGWIARSWQLVPVNRIQTVDHTQAMLERVFDVATLRVQTASFAGSSTIEGMDADEARVLSEELAARAATLRDDAT